MTRRSKPVGDFGSWLASMLQMRYMTQTDLAAEMGIDQPQVSKWVRGRIPNAPYCEAIARALGLPEYEVLSRANHVAAVNRIPVAHPVRERGHAIIDTMDPDVLEPFIIIMERMQALAMRDGGS